MYFVSKCATFEIRGCFEIFMQALSEGFFTPVCFVMGTVVTGY